MSFRADPVYYYAYDSGLATALSDNQSIELMNESPATWPPAGEWIKGWRLRYSAWTHAPIPGDAVCFRTMTAAGDLAPDTDQADWSLYAGARDLQDPDQVWMLANGYRMEKHNAHLTVAVIAPGTLIGESSRQTPPTLFSAERDVHELDDISWLETDDRQVVLLRAADNGTFRFALVITTDDHHTAVRQARAALDQSPVQAFEKEIARRAGFWGDHTQTEIDRYLLAFSLETLIGRLRPPGERFPFHWSAADIDGREYFLVNDVYALAHAWSRIDNAIAADLVKSALAWPQSDGAILARRRANGAPAGEELAWPLLAQAARAVHRAGAPPDFFAYVQPRLRAYVGACLKRFEYRGMHVWRSPDEAFMTDLYDRELATVDLTSFLLAEIDVLTELHAESAEVNAGLEPVRKERDQLVSHLSSLLWDERTRSFRDRYIAGAHVNRLTLSTFMPLLWPGLDAEQASALLRQFSSARELQKEGGMPMWQARPEDPEPAPISAPYQIFMLHALKRAPDPHELYQLQSRLRAAVRRHFRRSGDLPVDLLAAARVEHDEAQPLRQHPASAALILELESESEWASMRWRQQSRVLRWMDCHRLMVLGVPAFLAILAVAVISIAYLYKKAPTRTDTHALVGVAQRYYRDGEYEKAAAIYRDVIDTFGGTAHVYYHLGNALFRKGDYDGAETAYRESIDGGLITPHTYRNLALTLYRQDRLQEAREYYRLLIEEFAPYYPALADQARTSIEIIDKESSVK